MGWAGGKRNFHQTYSFSWIPAHSMGGHVWFSPFCSPHPVEKEPHKGKGVPILTYKLNGQYTPCSAWALAVALWPPCQLKLKLWWQEAYYISRCTSQPDAWKSCFFFYTHLLQPSWLESVERVLVAASGAAGWGFWLGEKQNNSLMSILICCHDLYSHLHLFVIFSS